MNLSAWHDRLKRHFEDLRRSRSASAGDKPVFALEHGLSTDELRALSAEIRLHIANHEPASNHALPWVVYAAEIGYRYAGDEYWQTFEEETPGWLTRGHREWVRDQFRWFCDQFHGACPSGSWASHFSIICWPITHAILPRDLQQQLARILYQLRHSFSAHHFESPSALGKLIETRSWDATSRFKNLAQETALVGQIAAALLLEGEQGSAGLLLPATLKRIGDDLDHERRAREWLRRARHLAQERARFRGLSTPRPAGYADSSRTERAREEVAALGIEPRLVLYPNGPEDSSWDVWLEIPDLSHLLERFPAYRDALTSRCGVAGSSGRLLARGFLFQGKGSHRIRLGRWPRHDELLLKFEESLPQVEYLLRSECLLRPGPIWLFRIASDRLAYELRSLRVRPGQRYVLVSTADSIYSAIGAHRTSLSCEGVHAVVFDLPSALSQELADALKGLGLTQAKNIQVWPAGLAAAEWDGEGHGEWLSTEKPCIGIRGDHDLSAVKVAIGLDALKELDLGPMKSGAPIFIELPTLPAGAYKLRVSACEHTGDELLGELDLVIREPQEWAPGATPQGPLVFQVEPSVPTLEQLWEGRVELELHGPLGRAVVCTVKLFEKEDAPPIVSKELPPLQLPVTPSGWKAHFSKHFREMETFQNAYDASRACELEFRAEELGAVFLTCEREFTPLRWVLRREGPRQMLILVDDTGGSPPAAVDQFRFKTPDVRQRSHPDLATRTMEVPKDGAMFVARQGDSTAAVIAPPERRTFTKLEDLGCNPQILSRTRSPDAAAWIVQLIELWSCARLTGNLLSQTRQRQVLYALTRHLFYVLGGEGWEEAEASIPDGDEEFEHLKRAVSSKFEERGFAAKIALECAALMASTKEQRIQRFTSYARSFLHLPRASEESMQNIGATLVRKQVERTPDDPDWLCEFAIRLASDPTRAAAWARGATLGGLTKLYERPVLARAARFLVLAVSRKVENRVTCGGRLYAGWDWE